MSRKRWKRSLCGIMSAAVFASSIGMPLDAYASIGSPGKQYYFVNMDGSEKELVIDENNNGGLEAGNGAIAWIREEKADHCWNLISGEDGTYNIQNDNSKLMLAPVSDEAEALLVQQAAEQDDLKQSWAFESVDTEQNIYRIKNVATDLYMEKKAENTMQQGWRVDIIQNTLDEANNGQLWHLEDTGNSIEMPETSNQPDLGETLYYLVNTDNSNKELVIDENHNGGMGIGNGAITWTREDKEDHWWKFEKRTNGKYQIVNVKSGYALTPRSEETEAILEQQVIDVENDLQTWIVEVVNKNESTFRIKNAVTGLYIEKKSETEMIGGWRVDVIQTDFSESEARQVWKFEKTEEDPIGEFLITSDINRGKITPAKTGAEAGDTKTFEIVPDAGYQIERILVNETEQSFETNEDGSVSFTLENIQGDAKVSVTTGLQDWVVCAPSNDFQGRNQCLSSRVVEGLDGTLYCTFEWGERSEISGEYVFPIYKSNNKGQNWIKVGEVQNDDSIHPDEMLPDTDNGGVLKNYQWQLQNCPQLFVLPEAMGSLPAGTLLCAGNAVTIEENALKVSDAGDGGLWKTSLDLYYSTDGGENWNYISTLAEGGRNIMGYDPVWEPFFVYYDNQLICYFSDERVYEYNNNQKLVHRTTTDGINWTELVDDVMIPGDHCRPGMPIVSQMENGQWIYVYEGVGISNPFVSFYKISDSPLDWGDPADKGKILWESGSPYVTTLSDGRIIANTSAASEILINTSKNGTGKWIPYSTGGVPATYNRCLLQLSSGELLITGSGKGFGRSDNYIYTKLVDVNDLPETNINKAQFITSKKNDKVIGIWQGSASAGASAVTWTNTSATNQMWIPEQCDDGSYVLKNFQTEKVLAVKDSKINSTIIQADETNDETDNGKAQHWIIKNAGDGEYLLKNKLSGLYLSVNLSLNSGINLGDCVLQQVAETDSISVKWRFECVTEDGIKFEPEDAESGQEDKKLVGEVINLIAKLNKIGYDDASKAMIDAARTAYDKLEDRLKEQITNYNKLVQAEKIYYDLKQKIEKEQQNITAAEEVARLINHIGTVTAGTDSKVKIEIAKYAYTKLSAEQKKLVSNYPLLQQAEKLYEELLVRAGKAESDKIAAEAVTQIIEAIGTVKYEQTSKAKIDVARYAYNKLSAEQKKLVRNGNILTETEKKYNELKTKQWQVGKIYTVGNYKYKITSLSKNEVTLSGVKSKSLKKIIIDSRVKINGKSFKITAIGKSAFSNCKKATSAVIGKYVKKIGSTAFYKCSKLNMVTVKSKQLTSVGNKAFKGINSKAQIKVPSTKLSKYKKLMKNKGQDGSVEIKK